jgi:hypothetical protein
MPVDSQHLYECSGRIVILLRKVVTEAVHVRQGRVRRRSGLLQLIDLVLQHISLLLHAVSARLAQ